MRDWIKAVVAIIWSLWFGGIIALFVFVQVLFANVSRATFIETAPHLFFAFERYQLILAASALFITVLWRIAGSGRANGVFALLAGATLLAVIETTSITPRIEQLRIAGQTSTDQFKKLHGLSMVAYLSESILLLGGGIILLRPRARETIATAAQASPSQAAAGRRDSIVPT